MTRGKRQELSFPGQDRRNMKNKRITAGIGESRKHLLFIPFPCLGPHDRGNGANMLRSERYTSKRFCYSLNLDQNTFSKCKAPDGLYPARFFRPYNNSATASSGHSEAFWTADVRFIFTTASSGRQFGVGTLVTVVWARDILVLKYGPLHFLGPPATVDLEVLKSSTIPSPAKCINVGC